MGVLVIRGLLLRVDIKAPDFWNSQILQKGTPLIVAPAQYKTLHADFWSPLGSLGLSSSEGAPIYPMNHGTLSKSRQIAQNRSRSDTAGRNIGIIQMIRAIENEITTVDHTEADPERLNDT